LIYWKNTLKWIKNYATIICLLTYILIQGLHHGAKSANIWIYHMYQSKCTRQKRLQKYMKFWRSKLARLNNMFDTNIKENNKVVESPLIISKVMCITTHLGWEHSWFN
jgi:hypothetical protein